MGDEGLERGAEAEAGEAVDERAGADGPAGGAPSLFGTMGYMGSVNALAFGAGIVRQKTFAVFLGPSGYGVLSLATSFFELLYTVGRMGMHTGLLREMSGALGRGEERVADRTYETVRRVLLFGNVALALAVVLFAPVISERLLGGAFPVWAVRFLGLATPFIVSASLADAALNALGKVSTLALGKAVTIVGSLLVMVVLVWRFGLDGALVQIGAGALIGFLVSTFLLSRVRRDGRRGPSPPADIGGLAREGADGSEVQFDAATVLKAVLAIGVAQTVYHTVVAGNYFVFRSLVVRELGSFDNGIYQGVMGISRQYLAAITSGVFVFLYPRLSASDERGGFRQVLAKSLSAVTSLAVPGAVLLLVTRHWIVPLVFTEEFGPMVGLMTYSLVADVIVLPAMVLHIAILGRGRTREYMFAGVAAEALYLGAFVLLLRARGLEGAVLAYPVFGILSLSIYAALLGRRGLLGWSGPIARQVVLGVPLVLAFAAAPPGSAVALAAAVPACALWLAHFRDAIREGLRR